MLPIAEALVARLVRPLLVTLSGELGAGKTTLARLLIQALGYSGLVKSPTYTLVETYQVGGWAVAHLDLYRLQAPEELDDIGFRDVLDQSDLILVEWPERAESTLTGANWALSIGYADQGRDVTLQILR